MQPPAITAPLNGNPRVLIIDGHEVSRGVYAALLRTEGLRVVADLATGKRGVAAARVLAPDLVLLDVVVADEHLLDTIHALQAVPNKPNVVLTSSTRRSRLPLLPDGLPFLAKADITARTLLDATVRSGEITPE
jgi:CheY-like chemotaxis protein